MAGFFRIISIAAASLLALNLLLGLRIGDYHGDYESLHALAEESRQPLARRNPQSEEKLAAQMAVWDATRSRASFHILIGMLGTLGCVAVCSIGVTYFVGTSRWCKEVTEAYGLDPQWAIRSAALKRQAFPLAISSMVAMMVLVAMGGVAASPDNFPQWSAAMATPHSIAAFLTVGFVALALFRQATLIQENYQMIEAITAAVSAIRDDSHFAAPQEPAE